MPGLFIDTWGWIAWLDRNDQHHPAVEEHLRAVLGTSAPIYTSWAVVSELLTVAASARGRAAWGPERGGRIMKPLLETLENRDVVREVINLSHEDWWAAMRLRLKHRSVGDLSLVDCSIAVACKPRGIDDVLSDDEHLRIVQPGVLLRPKDTT